jgi:hypothetical protein
VSLRPSILIALLAVLPPGRAGGGDPLGHYRLVDVAPVTTFVYVARVSMEVPRFTRSGTTYESTYAVKVFPYSFLDEHGRLQITVTDETLGRFAAGRPFNFTGRAIRADGRVRKIEGRVYPTGPSAGRISVRVHFTRHIPLDFATTYTLPGAAAAQAQ